MKKINEWTGYAGEANIIKLLKNKGYEIRLSTSQDDMQNHIDFFFRKEGGTTWYSCDVKTSNESNKDSYCLTAKTWFGRFGCFDSEALDFFAFERDDEFVMVERRKIHDLITNKMIEYNDMTVYPISEFHGPYKYHRPVENPGDTLFVVVRYVDFKNDVAARFKKDEYQLKCIKRS